MPGPVSDSYDPEFGTAERRMEVEEPARSVVERINGMIGRPIDVNVAARLGDTTPLMAFNERELRIIRFCVNRFLEDRLESEREG